MKRSGIFLATVIGFFGLIHVSLADEDNSNQNNAKIADVAPPAPVKGEDVDDILTNNLMRAQTGSKSKWSVSNSVTYTGGDIDTPFSAYVPNISAGTGNTSASTLTDAIAIKYSIDTTHALTAGLGARMIAPLNGVGQVPSGYTGNKYDAYNPVVHFQYVYRWNDIQAWVTVGPTIFTNVNLTREGYVGNMVLQQSTVYEIAHSGFSVGALTDVIYTAFNGESDPFRSSISDYGFGFAPFIEYQLTQSVNLRSYWSFWQFEHIVSEPNALTFYQDVMTQSVGVGVKVIRDVFLYPNISFVPYDIRADRTNFGVSANINLF